MIQLWHWEIACSITINEIFFSLLQKAPKMGGWRKEESFSDYTVLYGEANEKKSISWVSDTSEIVNRGN